MIKLLRGLNFLKRDHSSSQGGLSPEQEAYVLNRAYVPEQIPSLMALISKGQPFLLEDHLGFVKDNWLILVGYPLEGDFSADWSQEIVEQVVSTYRPEYLWFIGPQVPPSLSDRCRARQSDQYLKLNLEQTKLKSSLRRVVRKAAEKLTVKRGQTFTPAHQALVSELMQRQALPPLIAELYRAMPGYINSSTSARLLNARDRQNKLTAFFVVEQAAPVFDTYLLGCYSQKNYIPHASDLLFSEMVSLARQSGKSIINLGLGVNEGISRFKKKWGGVPFLNYEFCECYYGRSQTLSLVNSLLDGNL